MPLRLAIVTPARPVIDVDVDSVVAPGAEGEFGVLPGHELLLAPLQAGVVRYSEAGTESRVAVDSGFAEITGESVTILADGALRSHEIERDEASAARDAAERALHDLGAAAEPDDHARAQERLDIAQSRVDLLG